MKEVYANAYLTGVYMSAMRVLALIQMHTMLLNSAASTVQSHHCYNFYIWTTKTIYQSQLSLIAYSKSKISWIGLGTSGYLTIQYDARYMSHDSNNITILQYSTILINNILLFLNDLMQFLNTIYFNEFILFNEIHLFESLKRWTRQLYLTNRLTFTK